MVKLLLTPGVLPNHRTFFSLPEGGIDCIGTLGFDYIYLAIYLHRKT